MSTDLNILLLGGDERYLYAVSKLSSTYKQLYLVGFDEIDQFDDAGKRVDLSEVDLSTMDTIILPVTGTTEDGIVSTTYSKKDITLTKEMITKTPEHCVIYTGVSNSYLDEITTSRTLVRIFARDDIAIRNSIPTAEATLQLAIKHTKSTIHGAQICVLGFGRVGFTVARLFANVGANVTVAVRKQEHMARIDELGMNSVHINELPTIIKDTSIFINTVPHPVLNLEHIRKMKPDTIIIDLASAPGGTDFEAAKSHGINAMLSLGLPGKTAPKTAGTIIAETLDTLFQEQIRN
ncbi:dipicolinate synthase subunit DpsA [Virgibacillus sp. W0430]|uniref:dipicolinate synthase subunit DpsA n=1 Tax=Virgibacillus sp. W0430 TaxID=3391580 RepID=UPI003F4844B9